MGREDYSQSIQLATLSGRLVNRNTILPRSRNTLLNLIERRIKPNNRTHYGLYPMIQNEYSATYVELVQLDLYPPIITITGGTPIDVYQYDTYVDRGVVVDSGSLVSLTGLSNVNTSKALGSTFDIVYHAVDGAGHSNSAIRTVTVAAPPWTEQAKIQSSDIEVLDQFGYSVSISSDGNTAIVGAWGEGTSTGSSTGAAYIFVKTGSNWTQEAKIQSSDIQAGDNFGGSVSISSDGNTAVVGAYGEDTGGSNAGAAYIFTRTESTWTQQAKIQSSDIQAGDSFSYSVSISSDGNTAIVGAHGESTGGAAYIFVKTGSNWTEQAKIQSSDIEANDFFGYSVSISSDGNTAIVGAYGYDTIGINSGAAYIFTRVGSTWSQQAKIEALDKGGRVWFGWSVSISGDGNIAIVGARGNPYMGTDFGSAYIFTRTESTWTQQAKMQAPDKKNDDYFGHSVSISSLGNIAIVGAFAENSGGSNAGAAYIFIRSGSNWTHQAKILSSDIKAGDVFSRDAVSIWSDGDTATAIVGARWENTVGNRAGAAYIFTSDDITSNFGITDVDTGEDFIDVDTIWIQKSKIQSPNGQDNDYFGQSISISSDGNTAIVGALEDTGGTDAGAAYIFIRTGSAWTQEAKIQSSDIQAGDNFGYSVSISSDGNTAIVGAYGEGTGDGGAAYIFTRSGSTWTQQAKIQSSVIEADDNFGGSVSISSDGNTAVVGANGEDTGGSNAGAAYIFIRTGSAWTQQAKIQALDKEADDSFGSYLLLGDGSSVSISGDGNTVIVAAQLEDTGGQSTGAVYIFTRVGSAWTQQAKLQALDKQTSDNFGSSVSITSDGNTAIVGARFEDTGAINAGAAYIFTRSGSIWSQQAKIQASDTGSDDVFGGSVSISSDGNTVIMGSMWESTGGLRTGAAYIFTRTGSTWSQQGKIQASDKESVDYFGSSVSISGNGDHVIVGSVLDNVGDITAAGSVYTFNRSAIDTHILPLDISENCYFGWSVGISGDYIIAGSKQHLNYAYIFRRTGTNTWDSGTKIEVSGAAAGDGFGRSVDICGDYAIIGAPANADPNEEYVDDISDITDNPEGYAYIFRRTGTNTWDSGTRIEASDGAVGNSFGYSVSISGDYAIVGASTSGSGTGAVYIFHRTGTNTWDSGTKISAPYNPDHNYIYFGRSVAIHGDYAIVEAPDDGPPPVSNGRESYNAYIFHRTGTNTWDSGTKIGKYVGTPPPGPGAMHEIFRLDEVGGPITMALNDLSSSIVSIYGDYAILGLPHNDDGGVQNSGAAYIFHRTGTNTWDSGTKIVAPDIQGSAYFGWSVAIYGDYAVIGAWRVQVRFPGSGCVYIFRRTGTNTWDTGTKFGHVDSANSDYLGRSVAIHGDYVVAGVPNDDTRVGLASGSIYSLRRSSILS